MKFNKLFFFKIFSSTTFVSIAVLIVTIGVIIFTSWLLYIQTVNILTENLRARLLTISTTQAANIKGEDLNVLQVEADWQKPEWAKLVNKLHRAKYSNNDIVFMYIFRYSLDPNDDPKNMEFIADADSINPYANLVHDPVINVDVNRDGKVEPDGPDKLQWPGQSYPEAVDIPEVYEAYNGPLTAKSLYTDEYGTVMTGYAPIKDNSGNIVAILATDIKADDFFIITRQTLEPFLLFISLLSFVITFLLLLIIYTWRKNSKILEEVNKKIEIQKTSLEDLLKVKDETLHIVNHQLNTPLSIINSSAAMFKDRLWTEEKFLGILHTESSRISTTIAQFLAARKVDTKEFALNKNKTDLGTLVKSLIEEKALLKKVRNDNIKIEFKEEENVDSVFCDLPKINEVISNLLDNAISYSKATILIELRKQGDLVLFSIRDSGIGISKENIGKLFSRFTRLENAQKTRPDGTGLGLYVCKQIIEAHGGKIWVESEGEGRGSTFKFTLPI